MSKKEKLLKKYLEKKERQKNRDALLQRVKELQSAPSEHATSFSKIRRKLSKKDIRRRVQHTTTRSTPRSTEHATPSATEHAKSYTDHPTLYDDISYAVPHAIEHDASHSVDRNVAHDVTYDASRNVSRNMPCDVTPCVGIRTLKTLSKTRRNGVSLPITHLEDEIVSSIKENYITAVVGGTGTGKSTQVPQFLYENGFCDSKRVCITQPRRVSAKYVAKRISEEQESKLGEICGYKMRYDSVYSENTQIFVLTEGVLLQELAEDPLLSKYSVILLDEVHERSLASDTLLLVLSKVSIKTGLRLVIMSAGITEEYVKRIEEITNTNIPVVHIESMTHEVQVHYLPLKEYSFLQELQKRVYALREEEGTILAFVATKNECMLLRDTLLINRPIHTLHSDSTPEEQEIIFSSKNILIIATNAAETSLTLPDVKYVVDGGREIQKVFSYETNCYEYKELLISKSSADQRKGRTGRVGKGTVYRIYTTVEYENMQESRTPEILRERVTSSVVSLLNTGVQPKYLKYLSYITPPPSLALEKELILLKSLEVLGERVTSFGEIVLSLPISPFLGATIARVLRSSPRLLHYAAMICSVIETLSDLPITQQKSLNIHNKAHVCHGAYIHVLHQLRSLNGKNKDILNRAIKVYQHVLAVLSLNSSIPTTESDPISILLSITAGIEEEDLLYISKILSWSLSSYSVTLYKGRTYYMGEEVHVKTLLPYSSSSEKHPVLVVSRYIVVSSSFPMKSISMISPIISTL
ncbi:hypothetical protein NEFER03_1714 [Nematocida sp. LUAm3]|nr:hypothetical protein NEFER03_1714 [Nematocida sp. LUAm3]KAI5175704.1 hypothetical protein NEFER02_1591 [Nematocida sp. LUAm2]KAI5178610.1 hypothetical protein NEFER01_1746 [Nematocida sp. LUAm1]